MANITSQSIKLGDSELILEHGRFAAQASGAVIGRMGDTMVLATVVASKKESTLDYFPLSVEFLERLYAGGRISSSRFIKREGRPSENSVLTARLIDRSVRPLFPDGFKNEVQIVVTVLSVDLENDPDVLGVIAASAALAVSNIPWNGPLSAVRLGWKENSYLLNPVDEVMKISEMDLIVSGTKNEVVMVEAGMKEMPEEVVINGLEEAQKYNKIIVAGIDELVEKVGKPKFVFVKSKISDEDNDAVVKTALPLINEMVELAAQKKLNKEDALGELKKQVEEKLTESATEEKPAPTKAVIGELSEKLFKKSIRTNTINTGKRADGRGYDMVRELEIEVGIIPRTHGSAMFQRGMTQTLTTVTLGSPSLEQLMEGPTGEEKKRYMHHYNFPPYSVGEAKRMGSPGRREIGHGALAERALVPVIPSQEQFPYAIRVVNEIMSSNGSSSMASVCGSSLALMDAGVPIKSAVAGVAMGLMTNEEGTKYAVLTDIQGLEDAVGDMDFKVAGTEKGITALQMDIKLSGIKQEWLKDAILKAKDGRLFILKAMIERIPAARPALSKYAPRVVMMKIDPETIGLVIGGGGKTINQIISQCGVAIDIEDDGTVLISGTDDDGMARAQDWILSLTKEIKVGEVYEGTVKRILAFGAFIEILPGKEGMVHISKLAPHRVERVEDIVQVGDTVTVRVDEIDGERRINLTLDVAGDWVKEERSDDGGGNGAHGGGREGRFERRDHNGGGRGDRGGRRY
ncbi:MAG: polyribonucleotide nucleotidyltransferase [bacterium]|nr:polyribonucleotide nucleotidyltransferase [bacterium]